MKLVTPNFSSLLLETLKQPATINDKGIVWNHTGLCVNGSEDNLLDQLTNLLLWLVELGWNSTHPLLLVRIPENIWSGNLCMNE